MKSRTSAVALVLVGISVALVGAQAQQQQAGTGPKPADPFQLAFKPGETQSGKVTDPRLLREVRPRYTADAMRAKIQGTVELEAIVEPDGMIRNVRVTKSLDSTFGLDREAMAAAKQWVFEPGMLNGRAVPVLVTLILEFRLSRNPGPAGPAAADQSKVDEFMKGVTREGDPGAVEPKLLQQFRPNYTRAAMQEKIQGVVEIEAVVMPDGSVGRARITKSLDKIYGLDAEALASARRARFEPNSGTLNGTPVPFLVTIVQEFRLH